MKNSRFTESQIVSILKEADAGSKVREICRRHGISNVTYYNWKSRYGGMQASNLKRMKENSMSSHPTDFQGSVIDALRAAIERQISNSRAEINGAGGHFNIEVISSVFAGKGMLESQRLVYGAIAHLMKGDRAPVHAVDSLKTRTPE